MKTDFRKRIYEIIEASNGEDLASSIYDWFMIAVIVLSLIPLAFKETTALLGIMDQITVVVFIIDYALRLLTADFKLEKGKASFFVYPFTFMAIIDLLCILPSFTALSGGVKVLKVLRLFRALRVLRAAKMLRYSKSFILIADIIEEQGKPLIAVCILAVAYIVISAMVVFNVEPDSFKTFFDAVYWAAISLTTVGYGDIYPVTMAGRIITILSSLIGLAVIALPSGIITAAYMEKLREEKAEKETEKTEAGKPVQL